jgi:hypothetical protein
MGELPDLAKTNAAVVMRIETALAQASLTGVERRDPYTSKNKMTVGDLAKLAPNLEWPAYFRALDAPQFETLNVGAPAFFKELNAAGYYAYLWAEILDQDGYQWFLDNGGLTRTNGDRLRHMVLSRGNTEDPAAMYRAWLGRELSIQPVLKERGLVYAES